MKIELDLPDDVFLELAPMLDTIPDEKLPDFYMACFGSGLLIAKRSGSMEEFDRQIRRMMAYQNTEFTE